MYAGLIGIRLKGEDDLRRAAEGIENTGKVVCRVFVIVRTRINSERTAFDGDNIAFCAVFVDGSAVNLNAVRRADIFTHRKALGFGIQKVFYVKDNIAKGKRCAEGCGIEVDRRV